MTLRLFGPAREAWEILSTIPGGTVDEVLRAAALRYGSAFVAVLSTSMIWVNGEPSSKSDQVTQRDEVAVLPPVSGG